MKTMDWPGEPGTARTVRISLGSDQGSLPLVCRFPSDGRAKGYIIFCHGLGACGEDHVELSTFLASHGYLVIHPSFADGILAVAAAEPELGFAPDAPELLRWTTVPALKTRLYDILHTPAYWLARIRIVGTIMDNFRSIRAATLGSWDEPLPAAIAGHSFGAYTAQLLAGAEIDLPGEGPRSFRDPRFSAAILLSAQGRDQQGLRDGSWHAMDGPVLTVTGSRDGGAKGQDWHWKTEPFDLAPASDKYLAVLGNADHYLGGMTDNDPTPGNASQRTAVSQLTLAFLDAYLADDQGARAWLVALDGRIGDYPAEIRRK
ncbi:alpha/beta hydrolase family protein [Martelella sp. AMO21009]